MCQAYAATCLRIEQSCEATIPLRMRRTKATHKPAQVYVLSHFPRSRRIRNMGALTQSESEDRCGRQLVIPAPDRQRWVELCGSEASLICIASSRMVRTT